MHYKKLSKRANGISNGPRVRGFLSRDAPGSRHFRRRFFDNTLDTPATARKKIKLFLGIFCPRHASSQFHFLATLAGVGSLRHAPVYRKDFLSKD
jgi:hypothetical protein